MTTYECWEQVPRTLETLSVWFRLHDRVLVPGQDDLPRATVYGTAGTRSSRVRFDLYHVDQTTTLPEARARRRAAAVRRGYALADF